jgi:hypothetical protein
MTPQKHKTLELLREAVPTLVGRIPVSAQGIPSFDGLSPDEWYEALTAILERRPELRARLEAGLEGRCVGCDE